MKNLYSKSRLKKLALIRARKKAKKRKIKRVKARLLPPENNTLAFDEEERRYYETQAHMKYLCEMETLKLRAEQTRLQNEYSKAENERSRIHGVHDSARSKGTNHTPDTSR